jgi:hypothetical protein
MLSPALTHGPVRPPAHQAFFRAEACSDSKLYYMFNMFDIHAKKQLFYNFSMLGYLVHISFCISSYIKVYKKNFFQHTFCSIPDFQLWLWFRGREQLGRYFPFLVQVLVVLPPLRFLNTHAPCTVHW